MANSQHPPEVSAPPELKELHQWILWGYVNGAKIPFQVNRRRAKVNDPSTWSTFQEAIAAWQREPGRYAGVAFVFQSDDPFCGIDLDDCLLHDGSLKPWAQVILARFSGTYWEISPSGRGLKGWIRAKLPGCGITQVPREGGGSVEIYNQKRFFCFTGRRWEGSPLHVAEHQKALDWLLSDIGKEPRTKTMQASILPREGRVGSAVLLRRALEKVRSGEGRNNTGAWLAYQLRDNQYSVEEATILVLSYRDQCPDTNASGQHDTYSRSEALASVRSAYSRAARDPWAQKTASSSPRAEIIVRDDHAKSGNGWRKDLLRNDKGHPRALLANALTALRGAAEWKGVLAFDEFRHQAILQRSTPWGGQVGDPWTDVFDICLAEWLQREGIHVSREIASQAVESVAQQHRIHPVRDYLDQLKWDGVERLPSWLAAHAGVQQSTYAEAVGTCFLIGAVARISRPGCKMDNVLILEGAQGIGKSTLVRSLFSDPWFSDEIADLGSKDASLQTRGIWCIELAELETLTRAESGRIKAFISRAVDRFRPPYGKRLIDSPRSCVFVGTCNDSAYLKDETGGRRFWPVTCTAIDLEGIERDRDQLWAEAVVRWKRGESWWLNTDSLQQLAQEEQEQRFLSDPWEDKISQYLDTVEDTSIVEILEKCFPLLSQENWTQQHKMRVAGCLRSLDWEKYRTSLGRRPRRYRPKKK